MTPGNETAAPMVERGYQVRFLVWLALIFAGGAGLLFLALFLFFSRPLEGGYGEVFAALYNLPSFLFPVIVTSVAAFVLIVSGAVVVACVFALHKVAGPLYRMERMLEEFVSGSPIRAVFFRDGDQIAPMAGVFNGFVASLRAKRQAISASLDRAEAVMPSEKAAARRRALDEVEAALSNFR